jgi:hypothetical protein
MKFKVNKIAAAVAVSLGTSVVGMSAAQADEILFPYLVSSDTVTTILSVVNDDDFQGADQLHYRYYYKSGTNAASNSAACQEADYRESSSPNDIVTFDLSGVYGDAQGVLFEPAASQVNVKYDKSFALFKNIKPVRAYAVIDNNDRFFINQGVYGEAIVFEFVNGAMWGYSAYNAASIYAVDNAGSTVVTNPYDFSDRGETAGEVLVAAPAGADVERYWAPIAVMPFAEVTTRLFVTPIATTGPAFQLSPNNTATIVLAVNDPDSSTFDVMYDRDENPISGQVPAAVTCVGAVDVQNMISQAARQFVQLGGWTNVGIAAGQAVVIKLEFNDSTPTTLDGKPVAGFYNNSIWLTKGIRESMARSAITQNGIALASNVLGVYEIPSVQEPNSPFPLIDAAAAAAANLALPPAQNATAADYLKVAVTTTVQ